MFNYVIICKRKMLRSVSTVLLSLLGLSTCFTIDNQVNVVRNDCYERLALGQKLKPQDVDKKLEISTVLDCQLSCTEEGDKCRTFSFGIGVKGNATCELSGVVIKETPDLKPIGTVSDVEYDLYIKKIGCKLVIPNHLNLPGKPSTTENYNLSSTYDNGNKPYRVQSSYISVASGSPSGTRYGTGKPYEIDDYRPSHFNRPYEYPSKKYASSYDFQSNDKLDFDPRPHKDSSYYRPHHPHRFDDTPYRPDKYGYRDKPHYPDNIPEKPYYNGYEPQKKPSPPREYFGYQSRPQRPHKIPLRPVDSGDYSSAVKPLRPINVPQSPINYQPYESDFIPSRPQPEKPSNWRPNSEDYYANSFRPSIVPHRPLNNDAYESSKPQPPIKVPDQPDSISGPYRPNRPNKTPSRPDDYDYISYRPERPGYYGSEQFEFERPTKVPHQPSNYNTRPFDFDRPNKVPTRPDHYRPTMYDPQRPDIPDYDSNLIYLERPIKVPNRLDGNYYRPYDLERPSGNYGIEKPARPDYIPDRPYENDKPYRPSNYLDEYEPHSHRPSLNPHKPIKDGYGDSAKPNRPYDIPERPMYTPYHSHQSKIYDAEYDSKLPRPNDNSEFDPYIQRDRFDDFAYYDRNRKPFRSDSNERHIVPYKEIDEKNPDTSNSSFATNTSTYSNSTKGDNHKSIITETVDRYGNTITSILTEIQEACFRRVLAGKRVLRSFVRKAVPCERVEDCQRECSEQRRFVCEGFNYRLDPTGRGQGDCELLNLPLSRLDIRRDVIGDSEYDFYERDRNSDAPDCKSRKYYDSSYDRRDEFYDDRRRGDYYENFHYDGYGHHRRPPPFDVYDDYDYYYRNHRGGKNYKDYDYERYNYKYDPQAEDEKTFQPQPPYKTFEPYLPSNYWKFQSSYGESDSALWNKYFEERIKDKHYWGFKDRKGTWGNYGGWYGNELTPSSDFDYNQHKYNTSHKLFPAPFETKDWGHYGGSYGYDSHKYSYNNKNEYDYWGFNKYNDNGDLLPPYQIKPEYTGSYLPPYEDEHYSIGVKPEDNDIYRHRHEQGQHDFGHYDNNYIKEQCSLRMAAGFRLQKGIIKKITSVQTIYECELLCHKEKDFHCSSYAFRYTIVNNVHKENCYLSDRSYKELDRYTDLEPDRDYDIYTISNKNKCLRPSKPLRERSDCFWRVRNGQRLDYRIVRDSLTVNSIVECQLECLRSRYFTCRAFSYRYGPPNPGGAIDNCQLTDWPYYDLNPRVHFIPERGFEIYERGSYGYGCEPNHVEIGHRPPSTPVDRMDQVCYLKYDTSSRLLSQAIKKSVLVDNEIECKAECTKEREKGAFQCMSFSFRLSPVKGTPNCDLSDILQRDLLSNVDFVADPDAWLFSWDLRNPNCVSVIVIGNTIFGGETIIDDKYKENGVIPEHPVRPQDTWKVYSVSGYPCKRGSFCRENTVAGFWYCELEGREDHSWDYCCSPSHHCGYSEGFPYQWCYVGPKKTQWRKCNDKYYPYTTSLADRYDYPQGNHYLPETSSNHVPDYEVVSKPGYKPDKPPPENNFLDPPKPGGFGQSRHWPISYLHKELPQNNSLPDVEFSFDLSKAPKSRNVDSKSEAIGNLIETIKSNELKKLQEDMNSTKTDDGLHVKIPLPSTDYKSIKNNTFDTIDITTPRQENNRTTFSTQHLGRNGRSYARSFITRTNKTSKNDDLDGIAKLHLLAT
ncbi:hypothetical protein FQA39_LY09479 [Lamprigera yunnana]|nr:hypothetical protein FQA39_LY09479 [Lamprigera yunnana]